ncbi:MULTISPECIES: restriction endonuclease subunit S [Pseudoalteromonas]|uniref:Restriction endonuclease subunit S n=1 Tax=Pseudoalteromonas distincta TaxID=77608 RepID=A0ABT9GJB5_9GAMM|nr:MULTISPECIES: restriction endonuclease subunit S [Pseudoalteromonas]MDP4485907.1 restriction endonuclease subunit S [Pseudoalteromonas elyakovii]QQM64112.1 restriction endonuclease subunit S [Pseudoalteromonas sp. LC2018020214]|tara:strand:+ start:6425 stop:7645 length:1221 start_codon:yes stop_codon:yes gene_type:complete
MLFPTHWTIDSLGNLFQTVTGSTPPKSQKDNYGCDVPFVKPPELLNSVIFETADNLSDKGASISRTLPSGSILISCIGNLGKVGINSKVVAFNQQINGIKADDSFVSKFMFYQALSPWFNSQLEELASGTTVPIVNKSKFNSIRVVLPPIPEQKCIVAILDQAFADIEQARAKTEQNLKNARELFESYLQQVFSQHGDDWGVKKIAEIAETCLGKMLDKKKNKGNPKPYLRNQNVQWFNINTDDLLEMRFEDSEYERYAIKKGDLVICEGGYPGRGAIWEQDEDIFFQKALHRIRCHNPLYNRWVLYYLYLSDCNGTLKNSFTGAGIQHFTGKSLKQLALPIPPVELTEKFVRNFDELFNHVISLEHIYHNKLKSIDQLKKSILQKAFSGELTKALEVDTNKGAVA